MLAKKSDYFLMSKTFDNSKGNVILEFQVDWKDHDYFYPANKLKLNYQ